MRRSGHEYQDSPLAYRFTRLTLGRSSVLTAFTIAIVLLPIGLIVWGSQLAHDRTIDYFSTQMAEKAELAASLVDPKELRKLRDSNDTDNSTYRQLIAPLVVFFQMRQDVRCVHSFRVIGNERLEYVLDINTQLDRLGIPRLLPPSLIGDPFEGETRVLQSIIEQAGAGRTIVFNEPVTDQFGTFMGACSPVSKPGATDKQIVCVDFVLDSINLYLEEIAHLRNLMLSVSVLLSGSLGIILWSDRRMLTQTNAQLQQLARTDSLTGVYNRRHFIQAMEQELVRVQRYGTVSSLLLLDIDHFKQVNDNYGHACGDNVLVVLAEMLQRMLRPIDVLGRLGGEEFAILVPENNRHLAAQLAERVRLAIQTTEITAPDGTRIYVTTSIGIEELSVDTKDIASVLSHADDRMYRAKALGRNQIVEED